MHGKDRFINSKMIVPVELCTYIGTFLDLSDLNAWSHTEQEASRTLDLRDLSVTVYTRSLLRRGLPPSLVVLLPSAQAFLQQAKYLPSDKVVVGSTDYLDCFTTHDHDGCVLYGKDCYQRGFLSFVDSDGCIKTFFQRYTGMTNHWTVTSRGRSLLADVFGGGGMLLLTCCTDQRLLAVLQQIIKAL